MEIAKIVLNREYSHDLKYTPSIPTPKNTFASIKIAEKQQKINQ
jgi:hypothetical protein